jgi:hypothetical protein
MGCVRDWDTAALIYENLFMQTAGIGVNRGMGATALRRIADGAPQFGRVFIAGKYQAKGRSMKKSRRKQ